MQARRRWILAVLLLLAALSFYCSTALHVQLIDNKTATNAVPVKPAAIESPFAAQLSPIAEFDQWIDKFLAANAAEQAALLREGVRLAEARKAAMTTLIARAPEMALQRQAPARVRQALPPAVAQHLEERVGGRGAFEVLAATSPAPGVPRIQRNVEVGRKRYQAFVYGRRLSQKTKFDIPLHGIALDGKMAVHDSPVRVMDPEEPIQPWQTVVNADRKCPVSGKVSNEIRIDVGSRVYYLCYHGHIIEIEQEIIAQEGGDGSEGGDEGGGGEVAQSSYTEGVKNLILIRVDFSDKPTAPLSDAASSAMLASMNAFYTEMSFGRTSFAPEGAGSAYTPVFRMPQTDAYYAGGNLYNQLRSDARTAATNAGYNLATFNFDVICLHSSTAWGWGGLGYVGSPGSWVKSHSTGVHGHEVGHNYGLWHANYWNVSDDSVIGHGSVQEYGNSFDTMGAAAAGDNHFNAGSKTLLNWLPPANSQTVTTSGTYQLYPMDHSILLATSQKQGLKVTKSFARDYWIEFHQKFSQAENRWMWDGVIVKWNHQYGFDQYDLLLDTTPGSRSGKSDSAVVLGRTFSDRESGIHITPIGKVGTTPESMNVVVNLGHFPTNNAPAGSITTPAGPVSVAANTDVNFTVTASDPDSDPLAYYWDFGDDTFGANSPNATKRWAVAGDYIVRCTVSDMKGKVASDSVLVTVGAPTTFRISGQITLGGLPLEGVRVHNGQVGANLRATFTDSDGTYTIPNFAAGAHTISAAKDGYTFTEGFVNPVGVGPHAAGINFTAAEQPIVSITAVDANAEENPAGNGVFRISRTGSTAAALTVNYTLGGTASQFADFNLSAVTPLSIPIGASFLDVTLTPVNDAIQETPEAATMVLTETAMGTGYVIRESTATITIVSDETPPIAPEMNVTGNSVTIFDNDTTPSAADHTDFGAVGIAGGTATRQFTIQNLGSADLTLSGNPRVAVSGTHAAEFTVIVQPASPVAAAGSATVSVSFDPAAVGLRSATLTIANNDSNEHPYNFNIQGTGANLVPEIEILGNSAAIASGDTTPNATDHTDFGPADVTSGTVVRTFTIQNTGTATLNLSGNPRVAIAGADPGDFSVNVQPPATVGIGAPATFQVTFNPSAPGARQATVSIASDDSDENPYSFDVGGIGTVVNPAVSFAASAVAGSEATTAVAIRVQLAGPTTQTVTVDFAATGGTLQAAEYSLAGTQLTFASLATTQDIALTIVNDADFESDETLAITLSAPVNATLGAATTHTYTVTNDDAEPPPQIVSGPTATPNPALVNQSIAFSCAAAIGTPAWEWNFGDGSTASGASVTHAYTSAGVWNVTVTATANGKSTSATLSITVNAPVATGPALPGDSDGDGISDADELLDGTNPFDPNSTLKLPLQIAKMSAKLNFKSAGQDSCSVAGALPGMPKDFTWANATISASVGGATQTFKLDTKGKGKSGSHSLALKGKTKRNKATKKNEFLGGNVAFTLQLKKLNLQAAWAGVDPAVSESKQMPQTVELFIHGKVYSGSIMTNYSSKQNSGAKVKK